jgi:hypothetical protein
VPIRYLNISSLSFACEIDFKRSGTDSFVHSAIAFANMSISEDNFKFSNLFLDIRGLIKIIEKVG